jgi:hypothetical protein
LVIGRHIDGLCGWWWVGSGLKGELMKIEYDEERKTALTRLEEVFLLLQPIEPMVSLI